MTFTDRPPSRRYELHEAARIQAGYLSRSRVNGSPGGTHRLLQARDIDPEGGVRVNDAVRFQPERNPELYRVSRGDILMVARGQEHRAYLITDDLGDTLASSVFHIIRPREEVVLPGYLAWWLNQPDVQAEIKTGSRGTGIGYVSRQAVEHVRVVLPALGVQQRIAEVLRLWERKLALQTRLDERREQLIHSVCRQALRQEKE